MSFAKMNDAPTGLAGALTIAKAELPVFPAGREKRPRVKAWQDVATTNLRTIQKWWRRWPDALPAVPMGRRSGLFAVDADVEKKTGETVGEVTLTELGIDVAAHPAVVRTRSGGAHLFYRWDEGCPGNSVKGLAGVDIRSDGGFVVAWEPDILANAARAADLPPPPTSLLEALAKKPQEVSLSTPAGGALTGEPSPWAEAALEQETARVQAAIEGARNDTLNRAAFNLGQIVGAGLLGRDRVADELLDAALDVGLGAGEARSTITSGLREGQKSPRFPPDNTSKPDILGFGPVSQILSEGQWPDADMTLAGFERRKPPDLPLGDVFGDRWARWISEAAEAKGAPPDYVALALITVAGSLIGNARWVAPWDGWTEPPILWGMVVGLPSSNKSPAIDAVLNPLQELEREVVRDAERKYAEWTGQAEQAKEILAAWKASVKKATKDGEEPPEKPDDADPGPAPHIPRLKLNDTTIERLATILDAQPRGTLMCRDELAGWLANMTRYANGGSDRAFWLEAYGGRSYTVERVTRPPVRVDRLAVSILGGLQPDRLASLLIRADDDGLLARLIPVWPDPVPIRRPTAAPDDAFAKKAFEQLLALNLERDDHGTHRPRFVPSDEDARELMDAFRRDMRKQEVTETGLLLSFIGKAPGMAARLSLVLAYLDWVAGGSEPRSISANHFGRACHYVAEYVHPMARRAYAEASVPPEERGARQLADLIVAERLTEFSTRDIARRERQGLRCAADIEAALAVLVQAGWVVADKQASGPKGGRPRVLFHVNPKVRGAP